MSDDDRRHRKRSRHSRRSRSRSRDRDERDKRSKKHRRRSYSRSRSPSSDREERRRKRKDSKKKNKEQDVLSAAAAAAAAISEKLASSNANAPSSNSAPTSTHPPAPAAPVSVSAPASGSFLAPTAPTTAAPGPSTLLATGSPAAAAAAAAAPTVPPSRSVVSTHAPQAHVDSVPPSSATYANDALPTTDQVELDILKRRERVKAWQEAKRKREGAGADADAGSEDANGEESQSPRTQASKSWSLDDEEGDGNEGDVEAAGDDDDDDDGDDDDADDDAPSSSPYMVPPSAPRAETTDSAATGENGDEEADPLEAFMASLDASEEVVPQESLNDLPSRNLDVFGSNSTDQPKTISFEDLMGSSAHDNAEGWESDVRSDVEDDSMDEEQLERDRQEFMKAIRSLHGDAAAAEGEANGTSDVNAAAAAPTHAASAMEVDAKTDEAADAASGPTDGNAVEPATSVKDAIKSRSKQLGRMFNDEGDVMEEHEREEQERSALELLQEQIKKKELQPVDHTLIEYLPVRKNLYIVPRVLAHLARPDKFKEVTELREKLEVKVRGRGCPPPVETWEHCGLPDRILRQLRKVFGEKSAPFAIQKQGVPAIMSGRDVIGIAKTGSGKTMAFLLPMVRHIMDQPALGEGEGPIGLILAPARELAVQIYNEAKKLTKALGMRVTAVYGGAGIKEQIGEMKRGSEIVVCTPGRMIDILTMQAGKMVSLERVSFVVMDEADRMFDMGFEPQIRMIIQNIRPDRQTCLFSATFPPKVEALAKKVLTVPLEIVVGGRSIANSAITQYAEVRDDDDKFMRLLQLLGVWFERGNVLVFTDTQARCDRLFEDLMRAGYPCLSLHGGKDQLDRDQTIADFKNKVSTLMVATSVAGRGLDVPNLVCVVNYNCPNHIEDYVHRVGRTGRAGKKGTAYTFITPQEEQFAPFLAKALRQAEQDIPEELQAMADRFKAKVDSGEARWAGSGYGGSGFKFDETEKNEAQKLADMQRKQYEIENGLLDPSELVDSDDDDDMTELEKEDKRVADEARAQAAAATGDAAAGTIALSSGETPLERAKRLAAQLAGGAPGNAMVPHIAPPVSTAAQSALERAKKFAAQLNRGTDGGPSPVAQKPATRHFTEELVINDYPQKARYRVNHRDTIDDVSERFGVAIISRGSFFPPGKKPGPNEKKLYLAIEGHSELEVSGARKELTRVLNEETMRVGLDPSSRYSVV